MTERSAETGTTANLSDPQTYCEGHPRAAYDSLRNRCPLSWQSDAGGFWAVTGHAELTQISRDPARFCSSPGFKLKEDSYARLGEDIDAAMRNTIISMDPPEHTEFRRALAPFFGPQAIRGWEPRVRAHAIELLDAVQAGVTVDVVRTLTAPFPIRVLCDLLDVPVEDRQRVYDWTNRLTGADDPEYNSSPQEAARAFGEVFDYGRRLFAARRAAPANDILSAAATVRINGELLDERHTDSFFVLMIAAGNETTRNALTGAIDHLGRDPSQRQKLIANPELVRNAAEEVLRCVSPVIHMRRTAMTAAEIGGAEVQPGQKLALLYGAANCDPRVYPEPHKFDVERANARNHVAFGFATHNCLGAPLARLELRVFLEEFLRRFPDYVIADDQPAYLRSDFLSGIKRLKVLLK